MAEAEEAKRPALDLSGLAKTTKKLKKTVTRVAEAVSKLEPLTPSPFAIDPAKEPKHLLVIGFQTNWKEQFKGCALSDGSPVIVHQTLWSYIDLDASSKAGQRVVVELSPNPLPFSAAKDTYTVQPDFVLIRNFPTDLHSKSFRNILMGLMFAGLPSVNSLMSIFLNMERAILSAELFKTGLPVIDMTYHPNTSSRTDSLLSRDKGAISEERKVVKVGSCHSGYGKSRAMNESDEADVRSLLMLSQDYYTTEALIENIDFEFRIQRIADGKGGSFVRGFKRTSSSSWKNNWGAIAFEDYELKPHHYEWAEKAAQTHGGLSICALDVLLLKDGSEVILELNGTACGLMAQHERADANRIRDLVLREWSKQLPSE